MSAGANQPLTGIAYCTFGLLAFACQDTLIKSLSERYPVLEVLTLRTALVLTLLVVVGAGCWGKAILLSKNPRPMMLRGVFAFSAFSTYYLALTVIPLADAAAVYMTAPLFVTVLSVLLLREQVGWHRIAAVVIGFVSVIVMLNPGSSLFRIEAAMPLFSALSYAMIPILTRRVGLTEHPVTMAIYTTLSYLLLCMVASLLLLPLSAGGADSSLWTTLTAPWIWVSRVDFLLACVAACVFTVGLLSITQAYRIAAVSAVSPFEYSYLIWASLLGFIAFGHVPNTRTALGSIAIVACGCYIMYRERQRLQPVPASG